MGQGRLELPTSRLSGVRSNHLSYWPRRTAGPPTQKKAMSLRAETLGPSKLNPITSETTAKMSSEATSGNLNRVGFDLKVFIQKVNETP